jgi:surface polysaccharide O-acyltransferase-like enzyme
MSDTQHADLRRDSAHPSSTATALRDTDLDDFRAFALIWVLLLHCLYWFGLVAPRWSVLRSWALCEMPVLFFVAGASNSLGRARSARSFYAARLTRILFPFWLYAAAALTYQAWMTGVSPLRSFDMYWLLPTVKPTRAVAPLNWHLWFVPVYLAVMTLFPWLRAAFDRLAGWQRAVPLAALAVALAELDRFGVRDMFARYLVTYTFWAYLGLYYRSWKRQPWPRAAIIGMSVGDYVLIWRLLTYGTYQPDFQWSKFPPNCAFLLLGLGHFGVLTLAAPAFRALARQRFLSIMIAPYKSYGYTIYLFHTFGFALVMKSFQTWPSLRAWAEGRPVLALAVIFAGMVLVVPVLAWPFSFAERFPLRARRETQTREKSDKEQLSSSPAAARPMVDRKGSRRNEMSRRAAERRP